MATLLVITVLLPFAGSLALWSMPRLDYRSARQVALGCVLATLALSLLMAALFEADRIGPQFALVDAQAGGRAVTYGVPWLTAASGPGVRFALGLDGVSLSLFVLTALLMLPSVFASWESVQERAANHYALMLALATGLLGLFAALDVVLFYVFFEFTLIPLFFLIGLYGGPERRRASIYFFLYTLAGSLLTLIGVIALVVIHWQYSPLKTLTFSIPELTQGLAAFALAVVAEPGDFLAQSAGADLPAPVRRVRGEGAAVPVPYVASPGARRGADGRVDPAGGRLAQGRRLRLVPLQPRHDPARGRLLDAAGADAGGRRYPLWRPDRIGADRREETGGV